MTELSRNGGVSVCSELFSRSVGEVRVGRQLGAEWTFRNAVKVFSKWCNTVILNWGVTKNSPEGQLDAAEDNKTVATALNQLVERFNDLFPKKRRHE